MGIRFTILAPHQAGARAARGPSELAGCQRRAHRSHHGLRACACPRAGRITLFFYDGPISRAVAFEKLLTNGEHFADRLLGAFNEPRAWPQLVHIATDGETYGHHHRARRHGPGLRPAPHRDPTDLAKLTNYGEYLEQHPPDARGRDHREQLLELRPRRRALAQRLRLQLRTAAGWNQDWRAPLRDALDWLRDTLAPLFEDESAAAAQGSLGGPRRLHRRHPRPLAGEASNAFSPNTRLKPLDGRGERTIVLKLLELQRHAMLMYTSCGWFFDELSGIETVQVIQYAGRAIQLAEELFGDDLESQFLELLEQAKSNLPGTRRRPADLREVGQARA